MLKLSQKEVKILKFVRSSRHKTTVREIADGIELSADEVQVFVQGMVQKELLNEVRGSTAAEKSYYTNPEKREEIYDLIG
jgi:predicted transcriptional regulator